MSHSLYPGPVVVDSKYWPGSCVTAGARPPGNSKEVDEVEVITLYKSAFVLAAVVALAIPSIHGNLAGVKCIVDGNASATDSWSTNWHDGRIYFSSYESFTKFNSRPAAFELKANHQLLVTGQYEQHSCPCCGGAIDKEREQSINVGGVTVHFASPDCLDSISELPNITDRATAVYADEHFERTFQPVADDENN